MKTLRCARCLQICKTPHYRTCFKELKPEEALIECLIKTWPQLENLKSTLEVEGSVSRTSEVLGVAYNRILSYARLMNIKLPSMSEVNNSKAVRLRYQETCLQKYGTTNTLSKGAPGYVSKNKTVKNLYGVENVRMLDTVKTKITDTHLARYGKKRLTNIEKAMSTKSSWTDEQRSAIGAKISLAYAKGHENTKKKMDTELFDWSCLNTMNKLESLVAGVLAELGISYKFSYWIAGRQFDFKIGNLLLEVQGDFWHGNPAYYSSSQVLTFPGKRQIVVSMLWEKDAKKFSLQNHGTSRS